MRAIASVTLSFGLVSIPVKLYTATEASSAIHFKLMSRAGARVRQQYVADAPPTALEDEHPGSADEPAEEEPRPSAVQRHHSPVPQQARSPSTAAAPGGVAGTPPVKPPAEPEAGRDDGQGDEQHEYQDGDKDAGKGSTDQAGDHGTNETPRSRTAFPAFPAASALERHEMVRGYEFEKGRFVLFSAAELKAMQEASRDSIDIVAFIPEAAVDPIYYDKAYLMAPDKRGEKTYALLLEALRTSHRTALARWAWKGKEYVVQVRPAEGGLVLQQLLYADEVRRPGVLRLQLPAVGQPELQLALKLIEQGAQEAYDPSQFVDEEKQRILAAVEQKIAGGSVISHHAQEPPRPSGQVIDLLEALRASLHPPPAQVARKARPRARVKVSSRS